ncbi:MAG TPA: hypothetical protein VFV38_39755 [Ktedonobacteraceae bacterium]|nr:hypothetical protein [Ktedonobacteraceae bacterium]
MSVDLSLFRAVPEPRGCGESRDPGGCYAESGVGPYGEPLEFFMIDPPQPVPDGLDLINKPRILPRELFTGKPEDDEAGLPIFDVYIHVGVAHYPWVPDYMEETRRLGASRRLSPKLDFSLLGRASRMILAHPRAIPPNWQDLAPPDRCKKQVSRHGLADYARLHHDPVNDSDRPGPCIFKLWELIPPSEAKSTEVLEGQRPFCLRQIGSTVYQYRPSDEQVTHWSAGFILALPLTGFTLVQYVGGGVDEEAKKKLLKAQVRQGAMQLPFYEEPR